MEAYRKSAGTLAALLAALMAGWLAPAALAEESAQTAVASPLARRYTEGETLVYRIRGSNHGRDRTTSYTAQARGFVRRDPTGALDRKSVV